MTRRDACAELIAKIDNRTARIAVIGLGYVGLPLALTFAKKGFSVIGFDTDGVKCDNIAQAKTYIRHIPLEPVRPLIENRSFEATTDFSRLTEADCILICVPTPLTDKRVPDLSALVNTAATIARFLRKGQLVVLESTTYPETTEEELLSRFASDDMRPGIDFFLAFSPEREDPGNKDFSVTSIPKIVGGITPACLKVADTLYSVITRTVPVSSTRVAEFAKILENTFRSVNIALVNELKLLAHRMGIDIFEVIEAAATKPFGFMPFFPGPGLGGHCIPIDPFYLTWKAKEYGFATKFIELAGEINTQMPDYVVAKTAEALNRHGRCVSNSTILILGVAYKKDVDDDRESPAYPIMKKLMAQGATVIYNDPWVPRLKPTRKYDFTLASVPLDEQALASADAVLILADHSDYDIRFIVRHARLVIDTRNTTAGMKSDT
ncbi:MAG: nucleotide sugar dehydrogenase, partial [Thermodesulfobacteriota bacterium]